MYRIYTMPGCPYCTKAKTLLTTKNIGFTEVHMELQEERREFLSKLGNGWRSFPVIFELDSHGKPNRFIGGYDNLFRDLAQNEK